MKPLLGLVERAVLGKLQHADLVGAVGAGGVRRAAGAQRERGAHRGRKSGAPSNEVDTLHGNHPFTVPVRSRSRRRRFHSSRRASSRRGLAQDVSEYAPAVATRTPEDTGC